MPVVPLGMPTPRPAPALPSWRTAWDAALYGPAGFFRRERPAEHFRTSVHASPLMAEALARLTRSRGLTRVVDVGAGGGELLRRLHEVDPTLDLVGVEVAPRPVDLPARIRWSTRLPGRLQGLLVANEWLDNVPCHVVVVDDDGVPRLAHVHPSTGEEALGSALTDPVVPAGLSEWCARWWPLDGAPPGTRAEVGTSRDRAWHHVVRRVERGLAIAVDYGHTRDTRPPLGSLRSYRRGRRVDVVPDGSRDVTADVAVDAVAAAVGGHLLRQSEALRSLGASGARPDIGLARTDPAGYVRALARATEAAELTAPDGLGGFHWVVTAVGVDPL